MRRKPPFVREGLGGRHLFLSRERIRGFRFASSHLATTTFLPGRYGGRDYCDRRFRSVWYGCGDCLSFGEISAAARECTRCKCIHAEHDNSVSLCGEISSTVINRPCIRYHTLEHVITIASAQNTILKYKKVGKNVRDDAVPEEHTDSFSSASPFPPAAFSVADVRIRSLHILRVFTEGLYALAQADVWRQLLSSPPLKLLPTATPLHHNSRLQPLPFRNPHHASMDPSKKQVQPAPQTGSSRTALDGW